MDTADDMIPDNNSISLKTLDIDSTTRYSIQSSRGRIPITYHTSNGVPTDVLYHILPTSRHLLSHLLNRIIVIYLQLMMQ